MVAAVFTLTNDGEKAEARPTRAPRQDHDVGRRRFEAAPADQESGAGIARKDLGVHADCAPLLIYWVSLSSSSTW